MVLYNQYEFHHSRHGKKVQIFKVPNSVIGYTMSVIGYANLLSKEWV